MGNGVAVSGYDVDSPVQNKRSQNGYVVLFDQGSTSSISSVITIRDTPVVLHAYNLGVGETITVYTVVNIDGVQYMQPFRYNEALLLLDETNPICKLGLTGTYVLVFNGVLGNVVCVSVAQRGARTRLYENDLPQPVGAQRNRPNVFLADTDESQCVDIINIPWVFNAVSVVDTEFSIAVYTVYGVGDEEISQPLIVDGEAVALTNDNNIVLLDKSGRYKFVLDGVIGDTIVVGQPMQVSFDDPQSVGPQGDIGPPGPTGLSAYQQAVEDGFVGDEAAWLASLASTVPGPDGESAYDIAVANGFVGNEVAWLASLEGTDGVDGDSAYDIAVANGFVGDEAAWLASLEGSDGVVQTIVAGTNVTVDATDPANPIVSASGGSGIVETIVAGSGVTVDDTDPANPIVSASGGYNVGDQCNFAYMESATQDTDAGTPFPSDNSIPQIGEGKAYASLDTTITPKFASSLIEIDVQIPTISAGGANNVVLALFQDAIADALAVAVVVVPAADYCVLGRIRIVVPAVDVAARTYRLRWSTGGGTAYLLRQNSLTHTFGGKRLATMVVREIKQ